MHTFTTQLHLHDARPWTRWIGIFSVATLLTLAHIAAAQTQIDYMNLQFPQTISTTEVGAGETVYGQVYVAGLTDATSGQAPGIEAWVGVNAADTDPSTWDESAWSAATFNVEAGNNDEYQLAAVGSTQAAGVYYYATRFRRNGGPFYYGGFNAGGGDGTWDGTNDVSGVLTVCNVVALAVASSVSCAGNTDGSIDLTPVGGSLPYAYAWSNGATTEDLSGLAPGTYDVTVTDANGCTATANAVVTAPEALAVNPSTYSASCGQSDGVAIAYVSGGTAPFSYSWSTGATTSIINVPGGSYTILVTDANGCQASSLATVFEMPSLVTGFAFATPVGCPGDSTGTINLQASGGALPYTFLWSNGATTEDLSNIPAGNYSVTITDAYGCTGTASASVGSPMPMSVGASVHQEVRCYGQDNGHASVTVFGGAFPYSYNWSHGATGYNQSNLVAGDYTITVTDGNGCTAATSLTITQPDSMQLRLTVTDVTCLGGADGSASVLASGGDGFYFYNWSNGEFSSSTISSLQAGAYSVTVNDFNNCTATASFTVEEPASEGDIDFTPDVTHFGGVAVGSDATLTYTIHNLGTGDLTITGISSNNPAFSVSSSITTIGTGDSATFEVTFAPASAGAASAAIAIASNDCNEASLEFTATGMGLSVPQPTLASASSTVSGPFVVDIAFSEGVAGLLPGALAITNARFSNAQTLDAANYRLTITPFRGGDITISVPPGVAQSMGGAPNAASNTLTVYYDGFVGTCPSGAGDASNDWIQRVTINDGASDILDNSTGPNGGYANFDGMGAIDLAQGGVYTARIEAGRTDNMRLEAYRIWIDYNRDGDMLDAGEQTFYRFLTDRRAVRGTFSVPEEALTGLARMRVQMKHAAVPFEPCETLPQGETEDYLVNIVPASPFARMGQGLSRAGEEESLAMTLSAYPNPAGGTVQVRFEERGAVALMSLDGRVLQEAVASNGQATFDVSGLATGLYLVVGTDASGLRQTVKLVVE
jgi:hypothetical protein